MRRLKGKAELKTTEVEKVENASSIFYAPTILVAGAWLLFLLIEKSGLKTKVKKDSHANKLPGGGPLLLFKRFLMNSEAAPTFPAGAWVTFFVMWLFKGKAGALTTKVKKFLLAFILLPLTLPSVYSYNPGQAHLRLALTNPNAYCSICRCVKPIPRHFTLHGLWEENFHSPVGPNHLTPHYSSGFSVQTWLDYWPNLRKDRAHNGISNSRSFWDHEWEAHGKHICARLQCNQDTYFKVSLGLAAYWIPRLPTVFNPKTVINRQYFYDPKDIRQAIFDKLGLYVVLKCIYINNNPALWKIFFCVDLSGNIATCTNWYSDVDSYEGCNGRLIILHSAPLSLDLVPLQQDLDYYSREI